jgi:cation transport ATPase
LLILAKSLSTLSHHPLSKAIVEYTSKEKASQVGKFEEIK